MSQTYQDSRSPVSQNWDELSSTSYRLGQREEGAMSQIQAVEALLRDMDGTTASISQSVNTAANSVTNTVNAVGDVVHCVTDTVKHVQMVERQFQLVIAQMNNNVELLKLKLPTIEHNLDRIQQRLDDMNRVILSIYRPDMSETDLRYVNACLKAMEHSTHSLNNMFSILM